MPSHATFHRFFLNKHIFRSVEYISYILVLLETPPIWTAFGVQSSIIERSPGGRASEHGWWLQEWDDLRFRRRKKTWKNTKKPDMSGQISSRPHTTDFPQMVVWEGKSPYSREIHVGEILQFGQICWNCHDLPGFFGIKANDIYEIVGFTTFVSSWDLRKRWGPGFMLQVPWHMKTSTLQSITWGLITLVRCIILGPVTAILEMTQPFHVSHACCNFYCCTLPSIALGHKGNTFV